MNSDNHRDNIPDNTSMFEISDRDKKLADGYTVQINVPDSACVINREEENTSPRQNTHSNNLANNRGPHRFPTILKMVVGAVKRNIVSIDIDNIDEEDDIDTNSLKSTYVRMRFPKMAKILFSRLFPRSQPFCRKMDKITKKDEICENGCNTSCK
jgi:hypothetical protein